MLLRNGEYCCEKGNFCESSDEGLKAWIIADEREIRIERRPCLLRRIVVQGLCQQLQGARDLEPAFPVLASFPSICWGRSPSKHECILK
ncbi:MAG: hypothetical protein M9941_17410, partial [Anaerolineae bacterium]|nr:hypothetical protein [Anaerolineae bacterium]